MTGGVRVRLRMTGRVQGVGFRWFVREVARRAGVAGWVRNEPDGAVLLEVAGDADAVGRVETAVRRGPPGARVAAVERVAAGDDPLPDPFSVSR